MLIINCGFIFIYPQFIRLLHIFTCILCLLYLLGCKHLHNDGFHIIHTIHNLAVDKKALLRFLTPKIICDIIAVCKDFIFMKQRTDMNHILFSNSITPQSTAVPNIFIDYYMPEANNACIKTYLYLLRYSCCSDSLSLQTMSESIDETEKDVLRAVKYWEEKQLIKTVTNADGNIISLTLLDINKAAEGNSHTSSAASHTQEAAALNFSGRAYDRQPVSEDVSETEAESEPQETLACPPKPDYTDTQIARLSEISEIRFIISAAEKYLGRMLKSDDTRLFIYLYESLEFSTDLIIYLLEYCASRNKKSTSYIESVALKWHSENIDTVEKAEAQSGQYNSRYSAVNKAFGLSRAPGAAEKKYIDTWFNTYSFTPDIVSEACSRALLNTGRPDFKYANGILENWHKQGVVSLNDIKKLDELHASKSASQAAKASASKQQTPNRFNAFPQREYSGSDFDKLEKQILNRSR